MAAVSMVVAIALSLLVFVSLANVETMLFARDAVRAAVDEGVLAGARSDTPEADCETRARAVLAGLLGPATRSGIVVSCAETGGGTMLEVRVDATLVPWWPVLPSWTFTLRSSSVREVLP